MKRKFSILLLALICSLFLTHIVSSAVMQQSKYYSLGTIYQSNFSTPLYANDKVVAEYNGMTIHSSILAQQREIYRLTDTQPPSDREIIDQMIEKKILEEEAARQGLSATQAEIDEMVQSVKDSYELPDGKKILDDYCQGAGITLEEYFDLVREQAPSILARRKLETALGQEYCQEHGLEYTKVNPPKEMTEAVDQAIEELVQAHADEIQYYLED